MPAKPRRSVYVVPDGGVLHRTALAFRDCLRKEGNSDLREEYGKLKWELVKEEFMDIWKYGDSKTATVRKVLLRAGVSEEDIDAKERMRVRNWPEHLLI